jgi:hypothetical protein
MSEIKSPPKSKLVVIANLSEDAFNRDLAALNGYRLETFYEQRTGILNFVATLGERPFRTEAQQLLWLPEQRQTQIDARTQAGWSLRFVFVNSEGQALALFETES